MSNIMEVKFSAKSENESLARVIAASFAAKLDPTLDEIADIKAADLGNVLWKDCLKIKLVEIKLATSYILILKEATSGKDQAFTFPLLYQPDLALEKHSSCSPPSTFCGTLLE